MEAILAQDSLRLQASFRSTVKATEAAHAALGAAARSEDAGGSTSRSGSDGGKRLTAAAAADDDQSVFALRKDGVHAFWEVLSYPQLLEDGGIERTFLRALAQVQLYTKGQGFSPLCSTVQM